METQKGDLRAAITRTVVPFLTVWIVALAAKWGLDLNADAVGADVVTIGGSLWYVLVRLVEQRFPKFGWLLGTPKTPTYTNPEG